MHRDIRLLISNTFLILSSRTIIVISRGIYAILLARVLGPEIYGFFNYGLSWYLAFMPLAFWGISFIMSREIGKHRQDAGHCRQLVSSLFSLRLATSSTAVACCLAIGLWLEEEATGEFLIIGLSAALLGRSVAIWCSEVFVAYEKARLTFKLQSTFRLLEVFAGIALLYSGFGLVAIVALHVCSWWLEALAGLLVVRRTVAGFSLPRNLTGSAGFLRQGLPLTLLDLCSTWFMVGPVVMYRHLSNDSVALGELTFALQIFFMLVTVVASFSIAVLPLMSRLGAKQEGADFTLSFVSYKFGLLFAGMFIVTGSALAAPLTTLLLTEDYAATDTLIASALWLLVPIAAGAGLQQRLIAAGGDRQVLGANAAGALLMTLLFTFALKAFGVQGTILAAGSGLMLTLLLQVAIFVRRDGPAWITVSIKALGALLASYYLCVTLVPTNLWLASLLPPVALLMLYWLFVFDAEERNRFRAGLRNRNRAGGSNQ